ncbi:hypothetical protein D9M70_510350 [compost metagenome]
MATRIRVTVAPIVRLRLPMSLEITPGSEVAADVDISGLPAKAADPDSRRPDRRGN